ncbi:MAG: RNA polymerase sigma factor [Bacteroidales bacterium]|nr:RNA polymerase sigma factor [Bacteroidales bacterium]MCL2133356.1 RNA polymerase sigma factor [Bacteroidales bacterium]
MNEEELIAGCVRGNSAAQRQLYEKYAPKMMGVCLRYAGNRETARDLLHDGFIRLFYKINTYKGDGSFEGWMRRLFINTALEYLRKKDILDKYSEYSMIEQSADYSVLERLSMNDLVAHIAAMPAGFRMVFNLYAVEGYSHFEIAKMLNISESTSRSQYTRARNYLRKTVEENVKNIKNIKKRNEGRDERYISGVMGL